MEKFIIYIKTYSKDFDKFKILLTSILKYNKDNIPVYVSVNDDDYDLFKDYCNLSINLMKDSDIFKLNKKENWIYQQIIKSQLYRLNICENYICIDSDSKFIKNFYLSDFMYDENTPYTIMHQQKELFSWSSINHKHLGFNPKNEFENDRKKIMELFNRKGVFYDFGPSPVIWSNKVWKSFEDNYLTKNNLTFENIINLIPSEFSWYGEWLLQDKTIPIYPLEPLFKVFHYKKQYKDFIKNGHTEESIKENYLGIILQSNWNFQKKSYLNNLFMKAFKSFSLLYLLFPSIILGF